MTLETSRDAIIRFEPDGYDIAQPWLMGRQVAGNGFLRAAVAGRGSGPIYCHTPHRSSAAAFSRFVREIDPNAEGEWVPPGRISASTAGRTLYLADPFLAPFARARLREGVSSYALCGVTHTTATTGALTTIGDLLVEPVADWDALICTSGAVLETVRAVLSARADYLQWKFKTDIPLTIPQLPVIPLGVHSADFDFDEQQRAMARSKFCLDADEVAALFVGRLAFTGKAHPFPMLNSLQVAAERTGSKTALIQCGWAANEAIDDAFKAAAAEYAPDVRLIAVDGRETETRLQAWAAADLFISISDGVQETFGLTPLEAMAAGLPCVVSDWNGYKDTVRHGIDGFRIESWSPGPGAVGVEIAQMQEAGMITYDEYLYAMSSSTSVNLADLASRVADLLADPDLRRTMGAAGKARAQAVFDWSHIFRRYQDLWSDLDARRRAAVVDPRQRAHAKAAPKAAASAIDPFQAFGHYPTKLILPDTLITLAVEDAYGLYHQRVRGLMFSSSRAQPGLVEPILAALASGPRDIDSIAATIGRGTSATAALVGMMAKMGVVIVSSPASPSIV